VIFTRKRSLLIKAVLVIILAGGLAACDSMELTIGVNEPEDGWLEVVNSNDRVLKDAHLVVETFESAGAASLCDEKDIARWEPGQAIRVPACAEKVRFTLTTGGETARFSYFDDKVYRRIGRKEIPITN
jgi:hypothetical protein